MYLCVVIRTHTPRQKSTKMCGYYRGLLLTLTVSHSARHSWICWVFFALFFSFSPLSPIENWTHINSSTKLGGKLVSQPQKWHAIAIRMNDLSFQLDFMCTMFHCSILSIRNAMQPIIFLECMNNKQSNNNKKNKKQTLAAAIASEEKKVPLKPDFSHFHWLFNTNVNWVCFVSTSILGFHIAFRRWLGAKRAHNTLLSPF